MDSKRRLRLSRRRRFGRALKLRRDIIPHIIIAGHHKDKKTGEMRQYCCLADSLDDVLNAALKYEARLAIANDRRRRRRSK